MVGNKKTIELLDLIDKDFLQNFLDNFAKTAGVASFVLDSKGLVTDQINFNKFCLSSDNTVASVFDKCIEIGLENGELAAKQKEAIIYKCPIGFTFFAAPIIVNEQHIGTIIGGQILTEALNQEDIDKIVSYLGVNEHEYLEVIKDIEILPLDKVKAAADLLYFVATSISQICLRNFELTIRNEREILLRKITENIRSSLNIDDTLNYICDELAMLFDVQRATIIQYNEADNYANFAVRREYKSRSDIKGILKNPEFNMQVGEVWAKALEGDGESLIIDNIQESAMPEFFKENYAKIGQKSIAIVPIIKDKNKWGVVILSEYDYYRHWTEDEIKLLRIISDQIYIAIHQAELYNSLKKTAEDEKALRKIMSSTVKSLDIKSVLNSIVKEAGLLFKADRCIFWEYTLDKNNPVQVKDFVEYDSSIEIFPQSKRVPEQIIIDATIKLLAKREPIVIENVYEAPLMDVTKKMLIDDLCVKSFLVVPVFYGDVDYGAVSLHYVKDFKHFTLNDIERLKIVASQSAAVIHQAKLYSQIGKNEHYTRAVLNSIKDALITVDDDLIIKESNPAIESIWGYSIEECIGQHINMLFNFECEVKDGLSLCFKKNSLEGKRKNGEKFPMEVSLSDVMIEDKKVNLLVIRDITERKKMEKMKSEFVSTVSHELRTPLTSIRGSLGLVISGKLGDIPEKANKLLEIANNNSTRLTNLINDILDLEKIKAGKYEFIYEELEINSIIDQSVVLNQSYAEQFGMKIKVIKDIGETYVKADKNRLMQVFSNLFSNAVKFSKIDGEVTIKVSKDKGQVKVSFIDNGIGIAEDFKHKIFESFSQADSSDSRAKGGTGLGLSICKLIIENMGGKIDFTSELDKGSTFYFTLPEIEQGSLKVEGMELKEFNPEEDAW